MPEAYIVDAVRTPVGKRGGGLAAVHPADLGAHVLRAVVERSDLDPAAVEDVYFGCVDALGPQAGDIARTAWLAAGYPEEVPGTTIDRQCGSSQQALHFAAQAVMSGTNDVIVAGGVQNMSMIPIAAAMTAAEPENGSLNPNCSAAVSAAAIGIMLMFWTPPATMTSLVPLMTACAAKWRACCDEPHWRSMVVPGISSG